MKQIILAIKLFCLSALGATQVAALEADPSIIDPYNLVRHVGVRNSGIERDANFRALLERALGDVRDDWITLNNPTVETVLAALADPAPIPPQLRGERQLLTTWGCSRPDCAVKAAVTVELATGKICVTLHRSRLDPADPGTVIRGEVEPGTLFATMTFDADSFFPYPTNTSDEKIYHPMMRNCEYEFTQASRRAKPSGYVIERGRVRVFLAPDSVEDPASAERLWIWCCGQRYGTHVND